MNSAPAPRRHSWQWLGPFVILFAVLLVFAVLITWRDWSAARADGSGIGWVEAWKQADHSSLQAFFSASNFKIVLIQTVIVAIGALGMTLIIVSGGIDLSIGSAIALTSVLGAVLIQKNIAMALVIAGTLLAGGCVGLANGAMITAFRMPPFIVTLGMLGIARGLAKWIAGNQTVNFPNPAIGELMSSAGKGPPPGVWIAAALAVLMGFVMQRTVFGRHVFAIGSNEATARLCGIPVAARKVQVYLTAGLFVGLSGLMQMARLRQGDPTAAIGMELDVIAAVVIGGASLSGGSGSVLGSMVGALTMAFLRTGSQYMDWPNYMQEIIIGILIVLAVGLDRWRQHRTAEGPA